MKIFVISFILLTLCSNLIKVEGLRTLEKLLKKLVYTVKESDRPTKVRKVQELENRGNESVVLDFVGIVEQYDGYNAEEYTVTTEDGYILKLHRVYASPLSPKAEGKPVVYLHHGISTSSDFYVVLGAEHDLVYLLADNGYDVWLGNVRGTTYSRSHTNLSHTDPEFWDFSLDEVGLIDTPAILDFVLEKTGQEKLTFIGYSMGSTLFHILVSEKPDYNDKINLLIHIGPIVYFSLPPANVFLKTLNQALATITKEGKVYEVFPQSITIGKLGEKFCSKPELINPCVPLVQILAQALKTNISNSFPNILRHWPAGIGYKLIDHYNQILQSGGKFRKYNFPCDLFRGSCLNMEKYGQIDPPEYNVSMSTVPTVFFHAPKDVFISDQDIRLLEKRTQNVVAFETVPDERFNHLDYFWNVEARDLVYYRILEIMSQNL